ncbi:tyrosine--tRNA ligase [Holdemanella porci]|uniref:tyrosine--tRNA ligase n=1 Tax=Holdemanella porci TaxID=2652276 RepID=UPI003F91FC30
MELFEELKWRGLVDNVTSDEVEDVINNGEVTFYIGTDPTADSLHIGHYSSLLMAKRLEKHGHHPIMLVGGATGFIGDPKATGERSMLTPEVLKSNYDALHAQISKLWGFDMVNNLDWTKDITIIDFLRDYGKLFNVNYMLNKETVKKRLDSGISYTEFSYMILQSLDFLNLYQTRGCTMQIGGQDQWGNITSGLELIRKKCGTDVKCYGLTMPLITKADGTKFGKSETGTVWLDPKKTSPYELYQFLFNTDDSKVIEYLKKLTFLTKEEIDALEVSLKEDAGRREAQKKLAEEVVRDLHGEEGLESALKITNALFRGQLNDLDEQQRLDAVKNMDKVDQEAGKTLIDVLVEAKIASSRREAREWIKGNSISLNGIKVNDETLVIDSTQAYVSNYVIIRRGKKRYYCLNLK